VKGLPLSLLEFSFALPEGEPTGIMGLRGALGLWLRRLACLRPSRCSEACLEPDACLYGRIFEPEAGGRYRYLPLPFALRTLGIHEEEARRVWRVAMPVVGPALERASYLALALAQAGEAASDLTEGR